jgi:hypothetical protein
MTVFSSIRFSSDPVGGPPVAAMVSKHEAIGLVSSSFLFLRFAFVLSLVDLQGELPIQNLPPPGHCRSLCRVWCRLRPNASFFANLRKIFAHRRIRL